LDDDIALIVAASATIPGWTVGDEAREVALASLALDGDAQIVEVGVFMGRCTALLAAPRRLRGGGTVHCIDPFDCSGDVFSVPYYRDELARSGAVSLEAAFRAHMSRLDLDEWITVHQGTASEVARQWSRPVDLLLLDGDQSPSGARQAYEAWVSYLRPGGTLILRNTRDRVYSEGHDGHHRLALEEVVVPQYSEIRQIGATTIATKAR
jgi:Methyltransferase domain